MARPADAGRKRSGAHVNPRRALSLPAEAWELIEACCVDGDTVPEWIRGELALAVARQLGLDEAETVALFDERG